MNRIFRRRDTQQSSDHQPPSTPFNNNDTSRETRGNNTRQPLFDAIRQRFERRRAQSTNPFPGNELQNSAEFQTRFPTAEALASHIEENVASGDSPPPHPSAYLRPPTPVSSLPRSEEGHQRALYVETRLPTYNEGPRQENTQPPTIMLFGQPVENLGVERRLTLAVRPPGPQAQTIQPSTERTSVREVPSNESDTHSNPMIREPIDNTRITRLQASPQETYPIQTQDAPDDRSPQSAPLLQGMNRSLQQIKDKKSDPDMRQTHNDRPYVIVDRKPESALTTNLITANRKYQRALLSFKEAREDYTNLKDSIPENGEERHTTKLEASLKNLRKKREIFENAKRVQDEYLTDFYDLPQPQQDLFLKMVKKKRPEEAGLDS